MADRRARTRRLIELGGLVAKSGLEESIAMHEPDTAAAILGALLHLADVLREPDPGGPSSADRVTVWRDRGRRELRQAPSASGPLR